MNKKYLIKFLLLIFSLIAYNARTENPGVKDPTEAYNYWSKRGIIEVVYAFMNDYLITVTDSTLSKDKIKNCKNEE